eukprot:258132-Lingulodinium_polyedra.AAC.1
MVRDCRRGCGSPCVHGRWHGGRDCPVCQPASTPVVLDTPPTPPTFAPVDPTQASTQWERDAAAWYGRGAPQILARPGSCSAP